MTSMIEILLVLCGMDYSGSAHHTCAARTRICMAENANEYLSRKDPKKGQAELFYKCYTEAGKDLDLE